jgi:hypothetical protein
MIFSHELFDDFSGAFDVSFDGVVTKVSNQKVLSQFKSKRGGKYVILCHKGFRRSIYVAKIVLLTFKGKGYRDDLIAIHNDGDVDNDYLHDLSWGTRQDQAKVAYKNAYYNQTIERRALVIKLHGEGKKIVDIIKKTKFSESQVIRYLKRAGLTKKQKNEQ